MTDMIFITGVVIHARHGVMEHETEVGQRFVIDLELSADLSESSRTDRLADTVSYSNVVATATAAFKNANYKLLERAAGAVADAILAAFPRISAIKVTVHKPHAPIAWPIRCPIPMWSQPRRPRSRMPTINCWNARPAPLRRPYWKRFRASARSRSPFTSRTLRSPRFSKTLAWS